MAFCTLCAAIYLYYENTAIKNDYILLICVLGYVCSSSLGVLVIPWTLIGELLPIEVSIKESLTRTLHIIFLIVTFQIKYEINHKSFILKVKGKLGGVIISIAYVLMFGVVKLFPYIMDWMSIQHIFFIFTINSLMGVLFTYAFLPETLGKSFKEIELCFVCNQ